MFRFRDIYVFEESDDVVKADLHGTTLSHTTSLRQAYDMNCFV